MYEKSILIPFNQKTPYPLLLKTPKGLYGEAFKKSIFAPPLAPSNHGFLKTTYICNSYPHRATENKSRTTAEKMHLKWIFSFFSVLSLK